MLSGDNRPSGVMRCPAADLTDRVADFDCPCEYSKLQLDSRKPVCSLPREMHFPNLSLISKVYRRDSIASRDAMVSFVFRPGTSKPGNIHGVRTGLIRTEGEMVYLGTG